MAAIVLFHHVQGRTGGVEAFADRLRQDGHEVHVPDLFEGRTFASIDDGLDHVRAIGFDTVMQRGVQACAHLPGPLVFAGMSLGVMPAQQLFQNTAGALGAVFLHGFIDPAELGGTWPEETPVQVHAMDADPFFVEEDLAAARTAQQDHPNLAIHLYPGAGHLFTDSTSPDYDEAATQAVLERVQAMLVAIDEAHEVEAAEA